MSSANSTALTKRNASTSLMPPPPAPKRIKRPAVVLDEDTYVSAVSHIIRRDFFPGLAEADAQREYLNAVESKDKSWIRESGKKLTQAMTPLPNGRRRVSERTRIDKPGGSTDKTPSVWGADTPTTIAPSEADEEEEGLGKLDNVDLNLSLGSFQAKYLSEDQESFSQLIDAQNAKKFDKNAWVRDGNMYASKQRIAQQKVLAAHAAANETKALVTTTRPSQNLDERPAAPTGTKHVAFNTLMFHPDSVESWAPTRAQAAESASFAPPKHVLYNNTRLPAPDTSTIPPRPSSPTLSHIRAAVSGHPRLNPSEVDFSGADTPRVNGYAFVDAAPDSDSDSDDPPTDLLARYGVTSTSQSNSFALSETSDREKMALKMVDAIAAKRAEKPSTNGKGGGGLGIFASETPRFLSAPTPRGIGGTPGRKAKEKGDLTPAAQRLFERMGRGRGRGESGFGGVGGRNWTPRGGKRGGL